MTARRARPDRKRKWYGLALRHLRMASRLLELGFPDGAVFHAYRAYECALNVLIAARGYAVPPEGLTRLTLPSGRIIRAYPSPGGGIREPSAHKARVLLFGELADRTKPYFRYYATLRRYLKLSDRNDALYYDARRDRLPHEAYSRPLASGLLPRVRAFAREVWRDVR